MNARVGALRIDLGLNTAEFQNGLKRSQTQLQATQSRFQAAGRSMASAFAPVAGILGAGALTSLFANQAREALNFAANLTETSRAIGVTVEQYQILNRAALENGASTEGMERAVGILNRTLGQARAGVSAAADSFRALRIDPEQFRSAGEVLPVVMERISQLGTASEQAAAAQRLFGRSAQELLPMLVQGAEGYDRMTQEAREAGLITEDMANKADEAADKIALLGVTLQTRLAAGLIDVLPLLEDVASGFASIGQTAAWAISRMGQAIGISRERQAQLASNLPSITGALALANMGPVGGIIAGLRALGARNREPELELGRNFRDMLANANRTPNFGDLDLDLSGSRGGGGRRSAGRSRGGAARPGVQRVEPSDFASPWLDGPSLGEMDRELGAEGLARIEWAANRAAELDAILTDLPSMDDLLSQDAAERMLEVSHAFGEDLTRGLADAIVYGKDLGDTLVDTFQRAASELLSSGLLQLLTGQGGGFGGGIGSLIGSVLGVPGIGGGSFGPGGSLLDAAMALAPGAFARGGSFTVGGRGGIDRNVLSLNGSPVARVSQGETVGVGWGGGPQMVTVEIPPSDFFNMVAEAAAGRAIARAYPAMKADIRGSIADSQRRRG